MGTTVPLQPIAAVEINLDKLFTDEYEFVIPEYQRPYTWGVEHAVQLLVDLQEALERDLDEPYFLGSIVLVKDAQSPRAEVIDGQQRLVTLTLLLAVLRDIVEDPSRTSMSASKSPRWSGKRNQPSRVSPCGGGTSNSSTNMCKKAMPRKMLFG